jgi:hypothetical protein
VPGVGKEGKAVDDPAGHELDGHEGDREREGGQEPSLGPALVPPGGGVRVPVAIMSMAVTSVRMSLVIHPSRHRKRPRPID